MSQNMDCLRIHGHIEDVSGPFDNGRWVEIKIKLDYSHDIQGECRIRVWTTDASVYRVGQELCGVFSPVASR